MLHLVLTLLLALLPALHAYNYNLLVTQTPCSASPPVCPQGNTNGQTYSFTGGPTLLENAVAPELTFYVGDVVNFTLAGNSPNYPFILSMYSPAGGVNGMVSSTSQYGATSGLVGLHDSFTYTFDIPGILYYGASNTFFMGNKINIIDPATDTLCTYHTKLVNNGFVNAAAANGFMSTWIQRAFFGNATSVDGSIFVPGWIIPDAFGGLLSFFDGTRRIINRNPSVEPNGTAINFLVPGTEQTNLLQHFVTFFGTGFGCGAYTPGWTPPALMSPSMKQVHELMGINLNQFTYFTEQMVIALQSIVTSNLRAGDEDIIRTFNNGFGAGATDAAVSGLNIPAQGYVYPAIPGPSQQICTGVDCMIGAGVYSAASQTATASAMICTTLMLILSILFAAL